MGGGGGVGEVGRVTHIDGWVRRREGRRKSYSHGGRECPAPTDHSSGEEQPLGTATMVSHTPEAASSSHSNATSLSLSQLSTAITHLSTPVYPLRKQSVSPEPIFSILLQKSHCYHNLNMRHNQNHK